MSHKCRGPSCYRTLNLRKECPSCNRSNKRKAHKDRMKRAFDRLPKSNHWRKKANEHIGQHGLTTVIVGETLESPNEVEIQTKFNPPRKAFYKFYPKGSREAVNADYSQEGVWFRVVLDANGGLRTAFRDNDTERLGGRATYPTPDTKSNNPRWG